jgi:GT2 family glycosyltransferase
MLVSAVICAHSLDSYQDLVDCVDSLLGQTHEQLEIIAVIDGNQSLHERIAAHYAQLPAVRTVLLKHNAGVSAARNAGIKVARGEITAFIDDDALADSRWVENLLSTYQEYDAVAVGGKILPLWTGGEPRYLPEELYWLVGVTHEGFAGEEVVEVRNTFGPNMSFKREVFEQVGFFNENLGFSGGGACRIQAEEPEFALRVKQKTGKGVLYNPRAVVYHKIPRSKLGMANLLRRSFYQGYSKALMGRMNITPDAMAAEGSYLRDVLLDHVPRRLSRCYRLTEIERLLFLVACVACVGSGFVCARTLRVGAAPAGTG